MRTLLLILVIVLSMTMTGNLIDEPLETTCNLGETKAPITLVNNSTGDSEKDSLERRILSFISTIERCGGCARSSGERSPFDELRPNGPFDELSTYQEETTIPETIQEVKCACGEDCNCPSIVCKNNYCENNYIIIFASKTCPACRRMAPIVKTLRDEGYIVFYLDVESYPEDHKRFEIKRWPTIFVMENKQLKHRFNKGVSVKTLKPYIKTSEEQGLEPREIIK